MNIFVLDKNPIAAATMMIDKHVVKMPTESFQMISTNLRWFGDLIMAKAISGEILYMMQKFMDYRVYRCHHPFENDAYLRHMRRNLFEYDYTLQDLLESLYIKHKAKLYKSVMYNHPSTIWARKFDGATYLWIHAYALCEEYSGRYSTISEDGSGVQSYKVHSVETRMKEVYPLYMMYCFFLAASEKIIDDQMYDPNTRYDDQTRVDRMNYVSRRFNYRGTNTDDKSVLDDEFGLVKYRPKPAMADKYKTYDRILSMDDVVEAYRQYYLNAKWSFAEWRDYHGQSYVIGVGKYKYVAKPRRPDWWPEDHILKMQMKEDARIEVFQAKLRERARQQTIEQRWQDDNV